MTWIRHCCQCQMLLALGLSRNDSKPVVRGPPVVRSHLPGGLQARPNIYLILRKRYAKGKMFEIYRNFFSSVTKNRNLFM